MVTTLPIEFAIDETKFLDLNVPKIYAFSPLIPGKTETYIYNDEESYYKQYAQSYYAITCKKAGWSCYRHLEIIAAGAIPYFIDIDQCPTLILNRFPKDLVKQAMNLPGVTLGNIDFSIFPVEEYKRLCLEIYNYTKTHLTCRAMAQYILDRTCISIDKPKILFISGHLYPDYQRCAILIGLKRILGTNVVDFPKVSHLYKSYTENTKLLYGKGFSYSKVLEDDAEMIRDELTIKKAIDEHVFDLIIYGSIHRGRPLHDVVLNSSYNPSEIVYICGEDEHPIDTCRKAVRNGSFLFIREFC